MQYFITGATGFIGRRLVRKLLEHDGSIIFFLIRESEKDLVEHLHEFWGCDSSRAVPVVGDLTQPLLGVTAADCKKLGKKTTHFFHLAAIYDLKADAESQLRVNVDGTRNAVQFAEAIGARHFHLFSSIASAGLYEGLFREDMFEEAEGLEHPYFSTKHDSEGIVRGECGIPWRIYRPALVVGDSRTGEMDKIDGPYYFFKLIQRLRKMLPSWMPTIGIEGGRINVVPVDFVVNAVDHIAHLKGEDGKCFHLVDPTPMRVGDLLNTFARAAHAPEMTMRINAALFSFIPRQMRKGLMALTPVRRIRGAVMKDLGLPDDIFRFVNYPTRFDCRETTRVLKGTGIAVPPLEDYAWRLWDYWERHLDPDLFIDRSLRGQVEGQGRAGHRRLVGHRQGDCLEARRGRRARRHHRPRQGATGRGGARVRGRRTQAACLRRRPGRHGLCRGLDAAGAGRATAASISWSTTPGARSAAPSKIPSIASTISSARCSSIISAPARSPWAVLPGMIEQKRGHIINISSIGVLTNAPRFSAYVASKAALDAWTRCAASEFADRGINFTTINMPLVKTPMIAPTKLYDQVPTLTPEEAAGLICDAIIHKPVRVATRLGIFGAGAACAGATCGADHHEHDLPHVPGFGCGEEEEPRPNRPASPRLTRSPSSRSCAGSTSDGHASQAR